MGTFWYARVGHSHEHEQVCEGLDKIHGAEGGECSIALHAEHAKNAAFPRGRKTCCALIATSNVDNANRRQKRQKLNYKLCVILMQKGIVVFVFANYLNDVLVWHYAMSGFKREIEKAGIGSIPTCICVLNSLKLRFLHKNRPREWKVG